MQRTIWHDSTQYLHWSYKNRVLQRSDKFDKLYLLLHLKRSAHDCWRYLKTVSSKCLTLLLIRVTKIIIVSISTKSGSTPCFNNSHLIYFLLNEGILAFQSFWTTAKKYLPGYVKDKKARLIQCH